MTLTVKVSKGCHAAAKIITPIPSCSLSPSRGEKKTLEVIFFLGVVLALGFFLHLVVVIIIIFFITHSPKSPLRMCTVTEA